MRRREFIGLLAFVAAWPVTSGAEQHRLHKIGFMGNSTAPLEANLVEPFRQRLGELGYVEGRDILIEYRWAEGDYDRFPALVRELVASGVELIVTAGTPAALAVKQTTTTIPCVMIAVGDPVGTGLVASLAHPGANLTGLTSIAPDLEGKRLALLREVIPSLSQIAVFWNPTNPFHVISEKQISAAAQAFGMRMRSFGVGSSEELDGAFEVLLKQRPEALVVLPDRVFLHNRQRMMQFAEREHLPGIFPYREFVEEGGLISYGPNYAEMHRQAAAYVDKILKGANPAELPIQEPSRFELVINLRAANALGVSIGPPLLATADEVIE